MPVETILSLAILLPLIYAGLYMLAFPSIGIKGLNWFRAETHRIERSWFWLVAFPEPKPLADSPIVRVSVRFAGVVIMAAGLFKVTLLTSL